MALGHVAARMVVAPGKSQIGAPAQPLCSSGIHVEAHPGVQRYMSDIDDPWS